MRILVTGSNGFLGNSILRELSMYSNVTTLCRNKSEIRCDLSLNIPKLESFELIIHAAGKAHAIPKNEEQKSVFFSVNVKGTENLLAGLQLASVPKQFVFISSVAVYGLETGSNITEENDLSAKDPYGLSKIQAERIVLDWCHENNVICTILRLPLLVGKNPPGNLGAMIHAIRKGYYFNIGGGKAKKSMVLAEDVAHFISTIAPIGGIYNLTDGAHPSFYELSSTIARKKVYNLPLAIAKILGKFGDLLGDKAPLNSNKVKKIVSDLTFDDTKARSQGWNPKSVLTFLQKNEL